MWDTRVGVLDATRYRCRRRFAVPSPLSIETNEDPIFRTHTHELIIKGAGFSRSYWPEIDFKPALDNIFTEVRNIFRRDF